MSLAGFSSFTRPITIACASLLLLAGCSKGKEPVPAAAAPKQAMSQPAAQQQPAIALPEMASVAPADPGTVVAKVDDTSLTRGELDERVQRMAAQQRIPPQIIAQLKPQLEERAISEFIDTTLLLAEAARREITLTDAEIDNAISNITATLPEGMTIEQAAGAQGFSMDDVRKDIREGESLRKLYEQETKDIPPVTDEAVQAFYTNNTERFEVKEQASARHILIACKDDASEEERAAALAKAEDLRKQLVEGADFAELAAANSSCPSAQRGGDLGSFGRGQMVPEFEEAAFSQDIDAIGPVIKTQFGYHIVQVTARDDAKSLSLDESRERIAEYLNGQERNKHFAQFVEELRSKASIEKPE